METKTTNQTKTKERKEHKRKMITIHIEILEKDGNVELDLRGEGGETATPGEIRAGNAMKSAVQAAGQLLMKMHGNGVSIETQN